MVRYRMTGRDQNSSPLQYRTWIVNDQPDFDGYFYTGLKSGNDPLIDVVAYSIPDGYVADFNLPDPATWNTTFKVLPNEIYNSQLAILDGYSYLFGGELTNKIWRASLDNPADWIDTGATLPTKLHSSQLAIISDTIYLFGGKAGDGYDGYATDHIFSASTSNPLIWTDQGALLPDKVYGSQLAIIGTSIYLFGGRDDSSIKKNIYTATAASPLVWTDTGNNLPNNLYNSHLSILGSHTYLFGGEISDGYAINKIYSCSNSTPTVWSEVGTLPYSVSMGQLVVIAERAYLYSTTDLGGTNFTSILFAETSDPLTWFDAKKVLNGKVIPGVINSSQLAVIGDRIFLFGGNGSTAIFASEQVIKYNIFYSRSITYGDITRTEYNAAGSPLDLFAIIGFPYWKANFGS